MKLVVTGTRGIPDIMGGVETHCEELFRIADRMDTTVIRRRSYVRDSLTEWKGCKRRAMRRKSTKRLSIHSVPSTWRKSGRRMRLHIHAIGPALLVPYAKMLGMKVVFTHHGPDYDRDKWGLTAKSVLKLGSGLVAGLRVVLNRHI